jgi:hypothetical protein
LVTLLLLRRWWLVLQSAIVPASVSLDFSLRLNSEKSERKLTNLES